MHNKKIRDKVKKLIEQRVPYKTISRRLCVTEYLVCMVAKEMRKQGMGRPLRTPLSSNQFKPKRVEVYVCPNCGKQVYLKPCVICAAKRRRRDRPI